MPHFNQSTWLAYRAIQAQEMGDPPPPKMVALPGAKAAVAHDRLLAHHDAGHDQQHIVERVNQRWERENATTVEQHQRWASGPYADAIEELRRREAEKRAEEMRRAAVFAEILAEREQDARSA